MCVGPLRHFYATLQTPASIESRSDRIGVAHWKDRSGTGEDRLEVLRGSDKVRQGCCSHLGRGAEAEAV